VLGRISLGGRPPPVFRTWDQVSCLAQLMELAKPTVTSQRNKPVSAYGVLGVNCIKYVA
jgi:hypothetical protein